MNITKTTIRKKNAALAPKRPEASTSTEMASPSLRGGEPVTDTADGAGAATNPDNAASATSQPRAHRTASSSGKVARVGTPAATKAEIILKKLRAAKGASIDMMVEATGWQAHSVRGFLSANVKKKLGLTLESDVGKDGVRRYRIVDQAA